MGNNTYVIKKEPKISIAEPTLRTVYEEEEQVYEAPKLEYYRPQLGAIDPAVIKYVERMINSNTVVLFTSGDSTNCDSLVSLVKNTTCGGDSCDLVSKHTIEPENMFRDEI